MKRILSICSVVLLSSAYPLTPKEIAQRAKAASVIIDVGPFSEKGLVDAKVSGSGVYVTKDLVLTCAHIFPRETHNYCSEVVIAIRAPNSAAYLGQICYLNIQDDIAILSSRVQNNTPLRISTRTSFDVGETIYSYGSPLGLGDTFSNGIISSLRNTEHGQTIQFTAPISSGSSGSPLLDDRGDVIAIVSATAKDGQNINFASTVMGYSRICEALYAENGILYTRYMESLLPIKITIGPSRYSARREILCSGFALRQWPGGLAIESIDERGDSMLAGLAESVESVTNARTGEVLWKP